MRTNPHHLIRHQHRLQLCQLPRRILRQRSRHHAQYLRHKGPAVHGWCELQNPRADAAGVQWFRFWKRRESSVAGIFFSPFFGPDTAGEWCDGEFVRAVWWDGVDGADGVCAGDVYSEWAVLFAVFAVEKVICGMLLHRQDVLISQLHCYLSSTMRNSVIISQPSSPTLTCLVDPSPAPPTISH
jgi:hypothetical protein